MNQNKRVRIILGVLLIAALLASDIPAARPAYAAASGGTLKFTQKTKTLTVGDTATYKVNLSGVSFRLSSTKAKIVQTGKKYVRVQAARYGKVRLFAETQTQSVSYVIKINPRAVVGIDPGHQLRANTSTEPMGPGASTKKTAVAGGTRGSASGKAEYQLTLEIALKLRDELKDRGYRVVLTRTKNDVNVTNMERALLLNESCDIAIRLHADGAAASARGASALYPSASNPYVGALSAESKRLSETVLQSYCSATGLRSRGLSLRDDLTGTNWSTIPVTLIEMGFMTNTSDDTYMSSADGQQQMVQGLADGIDAYFSQAAPRNKNFSQ